MTTMNSIKLLLISGMLVTSVHAWAEEYAIVANSQLGQSSISRTDLKALMFGNKTSLAGVSVEPCLWGAKEGDTFYSTVLNVSKVQFNQEWVKKELTGAGRAPKSRDSADDVMACVSGSRGGIGFIPKSSASKADGKIKVLELTD